MAILDPRLLPLLDTLAESGADWLAFEIVDGVRRGREPEEREELLHAVRENVRSPNPGRFLSSEIPKHAEPILGDDQIVWAADYVLTRLEGALIDLDAGCAMIETIAEVSARATDKREFSPMQADGTMPIRVVVPGEDGGPIDPELITAAKNGIPALRDALVAWSLHARSTSTR